MIRLGKLSSNYPINFYDLNIAVAIDGGNKISYSFDKKFVSIIPKPVKIQSFDDVDRWYDDSMLFYCQQYKFALYCATALCGVAKDQLTQGLPFTKAIMNFHVLFQTKRILVQMDVRNPGDQDFDPHNNPYNKTEYRKILNQFDATPQDIPQIDQPAGGLGYMRRDAIGSSLKMKSIVALQKQYGEAVTIPKFPSTGLDNDFMDVQKKGGKWGTYYQFPPTNDSIGVKLDSVTQDIFDYNRVVPDHTKGLTNSGIIRLNDSIRAYVYCLLGAQVQARQTGSSLEAQQQFLVLVNDLIVKKQSLEESISNFEDALSKTRGKINYVIAKGLYMLPADMNLNKLGQSVKGFNDQIKIAQGFDGIGIKPDPPKPKPTLVATLLARPTPVVTPVAIPVTRPTPVAKPTPVATPPALALVAEPKVTIDEKKRSVDIHEGTKLLIGGSIVAAGIGYSML
jgi:hypothetical protein